MSDVRSLYLDLMKRSLVNWIYQETEPDFDRKRRTEGGDWPPPRHAHTLIGLKRLENIKVLVEDVLAKNIPGDLMETGIWRGGAVIFMRAILRAHNVTDRRVWAADSFEGFPRVDRLKSPQESSKPVDRFPELCVTLEAVKENFTRYGLLDEQVLFLKGWFRDTLPTAPIDRLAVLRLDGDLYDSTWDALENLYPRLSVGGYLIVDDYGAWKDCRDAVEDFRLARGIREPLQKIDWTGVYWQRGA